MVRRGSIVKPKEDQKWRKKYESYFSVQFWLENMGASSESTRRHWLVCVKDLCEWMGKNPDELIAQRQQELKDEGQRKAHMMELKVKQFMKYLEDVRHLAPGTRASHFSGIQSFFKRNRYPLEFSRGDKPKTWEPAHEGTRAASKDDIRKMIEVSNPRARALILTLKDSGLSETDVVHLELKDLGVQHPQEIFNLNAPVPIILRRQKTKRLTITFLGKESLDAVKNMLRLRMQGSPDMLIRGSNYKTGVQPENLVLTAPLFRSYGRFQGLRGVIRPFHPVAVSIMIRKAAMAAGVWKHGFSAHALRRFFQTSLESAGVSANWVQKMMGHSLNGSEAPYSQPEVNALAKAYSNAYPNLAISESAEQQSRVEFLEREVERLSMNGHGKASQIETLQERVRQLERHLGEMSNSFEDERKTYEALLQTAENKAPRSVVELTAKDGQKISLSAEDQDALVQMISARLKKAKEKTP